MDEGEQMNCCECGCGGEVRKEGNRFVNGHNNKGKIGFNKGRKFPPELYPNFGFRNKHHTLESNKKNAEKHRGKKKSEITRRKLSEASKGHRAWNKGLTKETDERLRVLSEKFKGRVGYWGNKKFSLEHRNKLSLARKGKIPWNKGLKNILVPWNKNLVMPQEKYPNIGFRSPKVQGKVLKGRFKRPTSLEQRGIEFHEKYNLPFSYCGNGTLVIGRKYPDFYENNGRKICLEYANYYWHTEEEMRKRIEYFAGHGWQCLVVWEEDLKEPIKLASKIKGAICDGWWGNRG